MEKIIWEEATGKRSFSSDFMDRMSKKMKEATEKAELEKFEQQNKEFIEKYNLKSEGK